MEDEMDPNLLKAGFILLASASFMIVHYSSKLGSKSNQKNLSKAKIKN
jgi:hypothetical protein